MSYGAEELLQEKQSEISELSDCLTECEGRAEKAEEALRKVDKLLEFRDQDVYGKFQAIIDECGCYIFHGFKNNKESVK